MPESIIADEISKLRGPIVVFGAGGFVGANLFRRLLEVRSDCYAVIHQSFIPWRLSGLPTDKILRCDITSRHEVRDLFGRYAFPTIFYFAAYGAYPRQTDPVLIYETNTMGLLYVTQEAAAHSFSALVYAGSSSEYGLNTEAPKETEVLAPNSYYATSKVASTYLLQYLGTQRALPMIDLRFYSIYGPWEEPDRLIPVVIDKGLSKKYPPFVDPEISRDFVYVDDAVDASILAATRGVTKIPGKAINVATGVQTKIRDIAALAKDLFQIQEDPQWSSMPNRTWDLQKWYGNATLAQDVLGWKAKISLREGLERTIRWTKEESPPREIRPSISVQEPVRLSAVIACYKDSQAIPIMHERLTNVFRQIKVDYEIIFVNDASPDNTAAVLKTICEKDDHVVAIEHSRNFGSQSAFLSGMAISTGDAVILLDGDLQDPPELIAQFYQKWTEGNEVVYGRRIKRDENWLQNLFYKAFYRLFRYAAYISIPLDAGDFSLMDRKVVNELLALPETDQFLRGLRAWVGFQQTNVDYVRPQRMFGASTNSWRRNIWWARKGIFSFSFLPLDLLMGLGIFFTILSFLALLFQVIYRLKHPQMPPGIATIIVLILFFSGVQLLGLSSIGEYVGKVLEETKRRPKYIRKTIQYGQKTLRGAPEIDRFVAVRRESHR